jgi:hypothetical protein
MSSEELYTELLPYMHPVRDIIRQLNRWSIKLDLWLGVVVGSSELVLGCVWRCSWS